MAKRQGFVTGSLNPNTNKAMTPSELNIAWNRLEVLKSSILDGTLYAMSDACNSISEEVCNLLSKFGVTLDGEKTDQLYDLIKQIQNDLIQQIREVKDSAITFIGYVSTTQPTSSSNTLHAGDLWINSATMPTTFPVAAASVKEWNGTAWVAGAAYTPKNLDAWRNINDSEGYYWFGGQWTILSTDLSPEYFVLGADGKWDIKADVALPGKPTITGISAASASTSSSLIATQGWVNDPARATNVAHRSGNETYGGVKTYLNTGRYNMSNLDITSNPSASTDNYPILFRDVNGIDMGTNKITQTPDGQTWFTHVAIAQKADGTKTYAEIRLVAAQDGTTTAYAPATPTGAAANQIATAAFVLSKISGVTEPVGMIKIWPGSTLPAGYLWCDGSSVDKNNYGALYNAIGTKYGGNGNPMFNLPNLLRCVPWMETDHLAAGSSVGALPNITGTYDGLIYIPAYRSDNISMTGTGALTGHTGLGVTGHVASDQGSDREYYQLTFNAGNSNSIYTNTDRVVPAYQQMNYIIKYT